MKTGYLDKQHSIKIGTFFHYRKPTDTGKGLYELKQEYYKDYSCFFYHYARADQVKVNFVLRIANKFNYSLEHTARLSLKYLVILFSLKIPNEKGRNS